MKSIEAQILEYLRHGFPGWEPGELLTAETDLFESGALESIRVMRLVAWIERAFKFHAEPGDLTPENFRTVADISAYVVRRRSVE
jgi:acyl carrier protein